MKPTSFWLVVVSFLTAVIFQTQFGFPFAVSVGLCLAGGIFLSARLLTARKEYLYLSFLFLGCALGSARTWYAPIELPKSFELLIGTNSTLTGIISSAPDIRESGERLTIQISKGTAETKILAVTPSRSTYHTGDVVTVSGVMKKPEPFDTVGGREFAYDKFLAKEGIFGIIQPASVKIIGRHSTIVTDTFRTLEKIKNTFVTSLEGSLPEPESALAVGLIAGGKQGLGKSLLEAFTIAGLLQIIVLSGYNVMIVAEGIMKGLSFLPRRFSILLAGLGIIFFVACAGGGSSAIRAGIMAVFALVARATGKTYAVVRALFITLIVMLLWNPLLLVYDPGLQFSFVATLGLIFFTPYVAIRLSLIKNFTLREIVATTISAQIAVLPILLWQTGNLSLVALPATILVMPVIPFAMGFGAIAGIAGFLFSSLIPVLALIFGLPAFMLLAYVIKVAEVSASLPYAHVLLPSFPFILVIICYAILAYVYVQVKRNTPATAVAGVFQKIQKTTILPSPKIDAQPHPS